MTTIEEKREAKRKVILQEYVTIDGFAADTNGEMPFVIQHGSGTSFYVDAEAFLDTVDTMVLGTNTYEMFASGWPEEQGAFAEKLNSLSKIVVSSTLENAPWGDWEPAQITENPTEKLTERKEQQGKDIVIWGSLTLAQSLMKEGLFDEIQLRVCPTVLGKGKKLFAEPHDMELLEAKAYDTGMVLSRYGPKNSKEDMAG